MVSIPYTINENLKYKNIKMMRIILYFLIYSCFYNIANSSERLELYFLSKGLLSNRVLSFNDAIQFNTKSRSLGFEGIRNNKKIDYSVKVNRAFYPIITYSDNINGGNLNQNIQVGNYTFIGDENTKAKSGIIIGGGALLGIKKLYDRGRYIDLNLNASIAAAPAHDWLQVRNEHITACSKNHVKEWIFFDACASWAHTKREFTDTIHKSISTSITRLFMSGKSFHESSLIAKRFITDEYQQLQGSIVLNSLLQDGYKTNISLTKGETVEDIISLNYSIGLSINRIIYKKPLKVSLSQSFYDGGNFLGVTREDISNQISVSYPLYGGLNVSIGYVDNNSTIQSFSHSGPLISVSFSTISF